MKPKVRITDPAIRNGLNIGDFIPSAVYTVNPKQADNILYHRASDSDLGRLLFLEIAIKVTPVRR
jgi:hypothetical protein